MDVYALDAITLRNCRKEVDDAARTANAPNFLLDYNDAYEEIIKEKYRLTYSEAIALDSARKFDISSLANTLVEILKISEYADFSSGAGYVEANAHSWDKFDHDTIVVPTALENTSVYVKYRYMPALLTNPTPTSTSTSSSPLLPTKDQVALTYYAAARYYEGQGQNKKGEATYWRNLYEQKKNRITDNLGGKKKFTNMYR